MQPPAYQSHDGQMTVVKNAIQKRTRKATHIEVYAGVRLRTSTPGSMQRNVRASYHDNSLVQISKILSATPAGQGYPLAESLTRSVNTVAPLYTACQHARGYAIGEYIRYARLAQGSHSPHQTYIGGLPSEELHFVYRA
eukprot:scaffold136_cov418-Prasinococcus_capsulatus_cf.AAC.9